MDALVQKRLAVIGALLVGLLTVWLPELGLDPDTLLGQVVSAPRCPSEQLCVAFLDVGQGDSIFIQSPAGGQMLIDSGRDSQVLRELSAVMDRKDRALDYALLTHPDADHVGGFPEVFKQYDVSAVIRTENESDTPVWQTVSEAIAAEGSKVTYARRGQVIDLGGGASVEILFPDRDMSEAESNTASIVAQLTYGETSFLLTGDSPKSIEEYLVLTEGEHLKSDVLKVGHHGSRTSTSELFLDEVMPTYAIISAGKDNSYGHPHMEVTDLLFNKRVQVLSTAEEGTIIFVSDGTTLQLE
ncbi:MBL fold metallo-hydrolase [Candidatus Kaiserbacteria bacterium]|nr:MBL fold metallo-hydrolase [Candidatus Kaiserbacteria bacterium]MCB9811439.1 MBL fold metallo-hydrolase [Candidatus Nomurabacteria bacterium]